MLNVAEIAASGVACLVLGTNDLLKDMGGQPPARPRAICGVR